MKFENVETYVEAETEEEAWKKLIKEHRQDSEPNMTPQELNDLADALEAAHQIVLRGMIRNVNGEEREAIVSSVRRAAQQDGTREADAKMAKWLAAAMEDPKVCEEMKDDINAWFEAREPWPDHPAAQQDVARDDERERCVAICEDWIGNFQGTEIKYTSAREYAVDAVQDIIDVIREGHDPRRSEQAGDIRGG